MSDSTAIQRKKLKQYIDTADAKKIKAFYTLLERELSEDNFTLSDEQVEEAERRFQSYLSGETKAYSWDVAKGMITDK